MVGFAWECTVVPAGIMDVGMWGIEKSEKDILSKDVWVLVWLSNNKRRAGLEE